MKNAFSIIKNKITQGYARADEDLYAEKSTNINVLLNRVRLDKKKESQKKTLGYCSNLIRCCFICCYNILKNILSIL